MLSPSSLPFNFCAAFSSATPPPETIPSFIAAFVACIASSTLSFFSFNSTSEFAPTVITATFPESIPNLSCSLSVFKLGVLLFKCSSIILILSLEASGMSFIFNTVIRTF